MTAAWLIGGRVGEAATGAPHLSYHCREPQKVHSGAAVSVYGVRMCCVGTHSSRAGEEH